jgi:hypothetical protein
MSFMGKKEDDSERADDSTAFGPENPPEVLPAEGFDLTLRDAYYGVID